MRIGRAFELAMILCLVMAAAFSLVSCDDTPTPTADQQQQVQQEQQSQQSNQQVGVPGVTNFTEKRLVRKLYELRDQNISTYAYVPDMNGRLWHVCDSIGYGLPYGVQFTNPEKRSRVWYNGSHWDEYNIPQAEPNGLFMPPTAEGTWIICASPKGDPVPVYIEPRVVVSPFRLHSAGEWAEEVPGVKK